MSALDKTRADFEAYYAPIFKGGCTANMPRRENGEYRSAQDQIAWMSWQEATRRAAQQPSGGDGSVSPTIVDHCGLPQAVASVLRSNGGIVELAGLYALIDAWGESQRNHAVARARTTIPAHTGTSGASSTACDDQFSAPPAAAAKHHD